MKISQVMLARGFGGAERLFVDLSRALAEAGLEVQAICRRGSRSEEILKAWPQIQLQAISVSGSWDFLAAGKISRLLARHRSDIVQAHLARAALLAGRACAKSRIPLVVTTHNYIDPKYYRNVSMLVPPTRDQFDYYARAGISQEKMQVIRHFSPLKAGTGTSGEDPQRLKFVSLGRLVEKKGFDLLIRAFSRLLAEQGGQHELQIGGEGPERARLLAEIEKHGLGGQVSLPGWIDDVQGFLGRGDVFVLPSLDEPFGIVVLEAMAAGLPIISSTTRGPREILDERAAWFCETGDEDSMLRALSAACAEQGLRGEKSRNAIQLFQQFYSTEAVIPKFIELYNRLLEARATPSLP